MSKIKFFQNEEEQACVVKFGNKKVCAIMSVELDRCMLTLAEIEHSQAEGEDVEKIPIMNDKKVYLEFNNLESINCVMIWMQDLKGKFIDKQISGL